MTLDEYVQGQRRLNWSLLSVLVAVLNPYRPREVTRTEWTGLVAAMFPLVQQARTESARMAREFYDSERQRHVPDDDLHPIYLADYYRPERLYEALEPAAESFLEEDSDEDDLAVVIHFATKQVEQAGRDTIREAVEGGTNQEPDRRVQGWARVAGGGESCAFCTIMISRGPVYKFDTAGLEAASEEEAVELWREYNRTGNEQRLMEMMNRWHPNCDCKVVPVFDRADWPGRDQYLEVEKLWTEFTKTPGKNGIREFRRFLKAGRNGDQESLPAAA